MNVLKLLSDKYNILNWLAILLQNRKFDLSLPVSIRARDSQVVIMSERTFDKLVYLEDETEFADSAIYYPKRVKRDEEAKKQYLNVDRYEVDMDGLLTT